MIILYILLFIITGVTMYYKRIQPCYTIRLTHIDFSYFLYRKNITLLQILHRPVETPGDEDKYPEK